MQDCKCLFDILDASRTASRFCSSAGSLRVTLKVYSIHTFIELSRSFIIYTIFVLYVLFNAFGCPFTSWKLEAAKDGDGHLSITEFCQGLKQIKGQARAVDIVVLQHSIGKLRKECRQMNELLRQRQRAFQIKTAHV